MGMEKLILKIKLQDIFSPNIIQHLCWVGYEKTGNKFSLEFHGSKGYFSHLEVSCEGFQQEDNRIFDVFNKDGSIKKKTLNIFHSERNGVRLSFGKDLPRAVEKIRVEDIGNVRHAHGMPF